MVHSVQLIIGRGPALKVLLEQWPEARSVDLRGGWSAVPVEDALLGDMEASTAAAGEAEGGLERALAAATRGGGALAYVETDYFGGTGGQSAMAFANGDEAVPLQKSRAGGAINAALRAIGVAKDADKDEFDTIGLGERRRMEDYEPEGPVRLRGVQGEPGMPVEVEKAFVPLWKIALVIVAMIAVALLVAVAQG